MGFFGSGGKEKPLTEDELRGWGETHIMNNIGPFWAALGFDSKDKIHSLLRTCVEKKGNIIADKTVRSARLQVLEEENGFYSISLLNGSIITFFPKIYSSAVTQAKIRSVMETGNLFEAFAELEVGPAVLRVFLTDYFENKEKYVQGALLDLCLGGIAMNCKPYDITKETFKDKSGKPLTVGEDFAGIFPVNTNVGVYSAVGKITDSEQTTILGEQEQKFKMQILNEPKIFVELIGSEKNNKLPSTGKHAFSNFWLQAHIKKNGVKT